MALDQGKQLGEETVGIAMINDHGTSRFAPLDSDKYGRSLILAPKKEYDIYSQGMLLNANKILYGEDTVQAIEEFNAIDRLLNGGLSVDIDFSDMYFCFRHEKDAGNRFESELHASEAKDYDMQYMWQEVHCIE